MADIPLEAEAAIIDDKPFDAADPVSVNQARKKAGRQEREKLDLIAAILESPQGRKYLFDLMERCMVFDNVVVLGDTQATYFNLGMRNIGLLVLQDVIRFPDRYMEMMGENK